MHGDSKYLRNSSLICDVLLYSGDIAVFFT